MTTDTMKFEIDGTYIGKVKTDESSSKNPKEVLPCGEGMISFPSLDTWQGTWKDGKRHGYCRCGNC